MPQVHPLADGVIRRSYTPHTDAANVAVMEFLSEAEGGELSVRATPPYGKLHFYLQQQQGSHCTCMVSVEMNCA